MYSEEPSSMSGLLYQYHAAASRPKNGMTFQNGDSNDTVTVSYDQTSRERPGRYRLPGSWRMLIDHILTLRSTPSVSNRETSYQPVDSSCFTLIITRITSNGSGLSSWPLRWTPTMYISPGLAWTTAQQHYTKFTFQRWST